MAQGFRQIESIQYDESSSPTPSKASIRMVLGIAAVKDWELRQLDVDVSYLEANIGEEPYVKLPQLRRPSGPTAKCNIRPCARRIVMVENVQRRTRHKGVRAKSGRPMRVQACTARESRRHHRGIRRRPAGGERNKARRGAGSN